MAMFSTVYLVGHKIFTNYEKQKLRRFILFKTKQRKRKSKKMMRYSTQNQRKKLRLRKSSLGGDVAVMALTLCEVKYFVIFITLP